MRLRTRNIFSDPHSVLRILQRDAHWCRVFTRPYRSTFVRDVFLPNNTTGDTGFVA